MINKEWLILHSRFEPTLQLRLVASPFGEDIGVVIGIIGFDDGFVHGPMRLQQWWAYNYIDARRLHGLPLGEWRDIKYHPKGGASN
jgi:hypothetical protein